MRWQRLKPKYFVYSQVFFACHRRLAAHGRGPLAVELLGYSTRVSPQSKRIKEVSQFAHRRHDAVMRALACFLYDRRRHVVVFASRL